MRLLSTQTTTVNTFYFLQNIFCMYENVYYTINYTFQFLHYSKVSILVTNFLESLKKERLAFIDNWFIEKPHNNCKKHKANFLTIVPKSVQQPKKTKKKVK